jgi:hypothetical protein
MQVSIAVSSVSDPDLDWTQIQSGRGSGIRIWIQEGKKDPHKYKKLRIFLFRSAACYRIFGELKASLVALTSFIKAQE